MVASWVPADKDMYLFDIDGVFLHSSTPFSERYEAKMGKPGLTTTFFKGVFQDCLIGNGDLREELQKRTDEWGWDGSVDDLLEYWFAGEANINEETVAIINELRSAGKPCYLLTNQEKYRTQYFTDQLGISTYVDGLLASNHLGVKKPDHEFYAKALTTIGFTGDVANVFYVDDDMENVTGAQEFGFDAFYYQA